MKRKLPSIMITLLLCSFTYLNAQTTYHVKANASGLNNGTNWVDAFTDLQSALAVAVSGDQIWVAQGTYKPTAGTDRSISYILPSGVQLLAGFPNVGNPTMANREASTNQTILSGDIGTIGTYTDNTITILKASRSSANTLIDGFIIENAFADSAWGGGLLIDNKGYTSPLTRNDLHVKDCIFRNHNGYVGVAIHMTAGTTNGDNTNAPIIEGCTFINNTANYGLNLGTGFGSIVHAESYRNGNKLNATIKNCTFLNNEGDGVVFTTQAGTTVNAKIHDCRFEKNLANSWGTGITSICNTIHSVSTIDLDITDCVFYDNKTKNNIDGGAIGTHRIDTASTDPPGHYSNVNYTNCTFYKNEGLRTGGIMLLGGGTANQVNTKNCIFYENTVTGVLPNGYILPLPPNSEDFRILSGVSTTTLPILTINDCVLSSASCLASANCASNIYYNTNPGFNNPTAGDLSLNLSSFATDKGNNTFVNPANMVDIAGNTRIENSIVDLGAYENASITPPCPIILHVNKIATGSNNGVDWANAYIDLQDALAFARANTCVEQIWVAEGTYFPSLTDRNATFEVVNDVEMYGGFPNTGSPTFAMRDVNVYETILSGEIGDPTLFSDNIATIISANKQFGTSNIYNSGTIVDGFSVTRGNLAINLVAGNNGSFEGIINDCKIHDNENGNFWGTAISISGVSNSFLLTPTIANCEIFNNRGLGAFGAVVISSHINGTNPNQLEPTFFKCNFYNNQATLIGGGGISAIDNSNTTIDSCRFYNNRVLNGASVNGGGGALYFASYNNFGQTNIVRNCLIVNNSASHRGGGIMFDVDGLITSEFLNCTIADNTAPQGGHIYTRVNGDNRISATNSIFYGGTATPWGQSFYLRGSSLTIANQINLNTCLIDATCSSIPQIYAFGANTGVNCFGTMKHNINPQFNNPATINYTLNSTSPAINTGDNLLVPATMTTDIAGNPRIHNPSGATVDLGCFENFPSMQQRTIASIKTKGKVSYLGFNTPKYKLRAKLSNGKKPYTYLWNTGETTANISPQPTQTTTYTVTITDADGNNHETSENIHVIDVRCKKKKKKIQVCRKGKTICCSPRIARRLVRKGKATLGKCSTVNIPKRIKFKKMNQVKYPRIKNL